MKPFITLSKSQAHATFVSTSLITYIECSYAELVSTFGQPTYPNGDGYKVDAEWVLDTPDFGRVTIYNYKDGKNYCGEDGLATEDIRDWHVGGIGAFGQGVKPDAEALSNFLLVQIGAVKFEEPNLAETLAPSSLAGQLGRTVGDMKLSEVVAILNKLYPN